MLDVACVFAVTSEGVIVHKVMSMGLAVPAPNTNSIVISLSRGNSSLGNLPRLGLEVLVDERVVEFSQPMHLPRLFYGLSSASCVGLTYHYGREILHVAMRAPPVDTRLGMTILVLLDLFVFSPSAAFTRWHMVCLPGVDKFALKRDAHVDNWSEPGVP